MEHGPKTPNAYYRVSVKALIINDEGKILVVNERGLGWDLPGGGLDWGESPIDGLRRELREELSCEAEVDERPLLVAPSSVGEYDRHVLWIVYKAEVSVDDIQKTDEISEFAFVSVEDFQANEEKYETMTWESPIDFWAELKKLVKSS